MNTYGRSAVALAVLSALVAGCGSSSPKAASNASTTVTTQTGSGSSTTAPPAASTTTTTLKNPCTYVTAAEITSATGKTITATKRVNDFVCGYTTSDSGVVNIGVAGPTSRSLVEGSLKAETAAGTLPPMMPGLGDVAYRTLGGIEVVKGTESIRITVFGSGRYADPGNAGAVSLARLILGRI
jgi:hypothetical protein